jgi:hypothetical protein
MDWRKMQTTFSWKPILLCTGLNLLVAAVAFFASFLLTANVVLTVFYTLFAWTFTVTISFLYWIWWFFKNIKNVPDRIKAGFTAVMLILLTADWMIIFGFLGLLHN